MIEVTLGIGTTVCYFGKTSQAYCVQFLALQFCKDVNKLEGVQHSLTKQVRVLEIMPYEEKLKKLGISLLEKRCL